MFKPSAGHVRRTTPPQVHRSTATRAPGRNAAGYRTSIDARTLLGRVSGRHSGAVMSLPPNSWDSAVGWPFGIRGRFSGRGPEWHRPVEVCVEGAIHHAHASLAELGIDLVMAELLADHEPFLHLTSAMPADSSSWGGLPRSDPGSGRQLHRNVKPFCPAPKIYSAAAIRLPPNGGLV